jgi:RNA 2',3'-cyclic 3'-phosphodiesterase
VPARVFVAIDLPGPARELLDGALSAFLRAAPAWTSEKPVDAALFHVTLAFLGAVPDPAMPGLLERLGRAAGGVDPFALRLGGLRAVPSLHRATMVWARLHGATDAASDLAGALALAGDLPREGRRFEPHVTLARARRPKRVHADALAAADAVIAADGKETDRLVSVRFATVFSSTLGNGGPRYEPLAVLALGERTQPSGTD